MIYLDHAATTPVAPEVLDAMLPWLRPDHVGNPGSIHTQGVNARKAINHAREQVAEMINADPSEIFFTSGGTESNNTWIKCIDRLDGSFPCVITTKLEHPSLMEPIGYHTEYVRTYKDGSVNLEDLDKMLTFYDEYAKVVSIMWVNNELGTANPIKEIGTICKEHKVPFHTDAIQAVGHVPIDVKECNVDFLSMSGHKFGASPGVGALYINNTIQKNPLIVGGGQENGLRGGTENVPGIVGLGAAAELVTKNLSLWRSRWARLWDAFSLRLMEVGMWNQYWINGNTDNWTPNIISMTIPGVHSESMLMMLDIRGICVSAGSACSASKGASSHVLRGIGLSDEDAACTIRISMGYDTTEQEMRQTAEQIADITRKIKALSSKAHH